jgi:hypothetical protein
MRSMTDEGESLTVVVRPHQPAKGGQLLPREKRNKEAP